MNGDVVAVITIFVFFLLVAAFGVGLNVGESAGRTQIRQEAIQTGVAYWDSKENGSPKFTWKYRDKVEKE